MFGRSSGRIDLPSMPATLARIIEVTNSETSTAEDLSRVVMLDQSLATKVLRLANSAYFGRRVKAETVTEAVVSLGFSQVRNLAASASVIDALFPKRMFPGFSWPDMWVHSVTCATASEAIYRRMPSRTGGNSEIAFTAGLLHDVGKLVLARALPHRFSQVVEAVRDYQFDMVRAETNVLSTDHTRVGYDLASQWDFPERLSEGIACHHDPDSAYDHADLARAIHAANLLAKRMSRNYVSGVAVEISLKDVAEAAGIATNIVSDIVEQVRERLQQCGEILSWGRGLPGAEGAIAA